MDDPACNVASHRLSLKKRCLFAVIPLIILLGLTELVARALVSETTVAQRARQIEQLVVFLGCAPEESPVEPDPQCFWKLKPNMTLPLERGMWWGGMMSNSHRHRSRDVSREEVLSRRRVLCLGDSTTFAWGVPLPDAWPNQLQTLLGKDSETFEVLNAGVPGHSSYQGRQRLVDELDQWHPELCVITFGNNDGSRWDDLSDHDHGRRWQALSSGVWAHSRALDWLRTCRLTNRSAPADELTSWAETATRSYFDPKLDWTPRVSLDEFTDNLHVMIRECRTRHCDVILIVWPDQRQLLNQPTPNLPYQVAIRQVAEESGARCVDLVPLFRSAGAWGIQRYLPRDVIHIDSTGNRAVAKLVAREVLGLLGQQLAQTPNRE